MPAESRLLAASKTGPFEKFLDQIRDRMAARGRRLEERYPRALDLASRLVARVARRLRGQAATFRGIRSAEKMREVLRGEREPRLSDVCIWATSPNPTARAAARDVVEELAGELGLTVRSSSSTTSAATFLQLLGRSSKEGGDVTAVGLEVAADGEVDLVDVERMLLEISQAGDRLEELRAFLLQERGRLAAAAALHSDPQADGADR